MRKLELNLAEELFLEGGRVARLATASSEGRPLVVPICYAFDGREFFSSIDEKPKRSAPLLLERIRNIRENAHCSLVVDRYEEDWNRLAYVLVRGRARVLTRGSRHIKGVDLLREKYPQYREMAIQQRPLILLVPDHIKSWGFG